MFNFIYFLFTLKIPCTHHYKIIKEYQYNDSRIHNPVDVIISRCEKCGCIKSQHF